MKKSRIIIGLLYIIIPLLLLLIYIIFFFAFKTTVTKEFTRYIYKNSYCYKLVNEKDLNNPNLAMGNVYQSLSLDQKLIAGLNLPLRLFDRKFCTETHITKGTGAMLDFINVVIKSGNYSASLKSDQLLEEKCVPVDLLEENTEYNIKLNNYCPTSYLSDLEKYGFQENGQIDVELRLLPAYPIPLIIFLFFTFTSFFWAWSLLLINILEKFSIIKK